MISPSTLREIGQSWGLNDLKAAVQLILSGSPERCLQRAGVSSFSGDVFILERISPEAFTRKQSIHLTINLLIEGGLGRVVPACKGVDGEYIQQVLGAFWQLTPYVNGLELDRPGYVHDRWRGRAMANFLIDLRRVSAVCSPAGSGLSVDLPRYIRRLMETAAERHVNVARAFTPLAAEILERFDPVFPVLPRAFCHGDLHPLNIIWGDGEIRAVIDWEFCGVRPELYDAANLIGCLGIEDPSCLQKGGIAVDILDALRCSGLYKDESFEAFWLLVRALRFAWLSEWLRKNDIEMMDLEFEYAGILKGVAPDYSRI